MDLGAWLAAHAQAQQYNGDVERMKLKTEELASSNDDDVLAVS